METAQNCNPHVTMSAEQEQLNVVEALRKVYTLLALSGLKLESYVYGRFVNRCEDLNAEQYYVNFDAVGSEVRMSVSIQFDAPNSWSEIPVTRHVFEKSDGSEWARYGVSATVNMSSSGSISATKAAAVAAHLQPVSEFLAFVEQLNVPNDHPEATYFCVLTAEQKKQRVEVAKQSELRKKIATAAYNMFEGKYPKQRGNIKSFFLKELGISRTDYAEFIGTKFTFGSPDKKLTHSFEIVEASGGTKVFIERVE